MQPQQPNQPRPSFFRANRPGNLNIIDVDESFIEQSNSTSLINNNNIQNNSHAPSSAHYPINNSQPTEQSYNLRSPLTITTTFNSNQNYVTSSQNSPHYTQHQVINSPHIKNLSKQQTNPMSPSYTNFSSGNPQHISTAQNHQQYSPSYSTPTTNANPQTSNTNYNIAAASPFTKQQQTAGILAPIKQPIQYQTPNYEQSFTPTYSPCPSSAHIVNNSNNYFNFDIPHINNITNNSTTTTSHAIPQSPSHLNYNSSNVNKIKQQQQQYSIPNPVISHPKPIQMPQSYSQQQQQQIQQFHNNQNQFNSNFQKLPHTPLTAVPFHHNNNLQSNQHQNHSLSVPSSPLTHNNHSVFQFNATVANQLQSIAHDSTPTCAISYKNNEIKVLNQQQSHYNSYTSHNFNSNNTFETTDLQTNNNLNSNINSRNVEGDFEYGTNQIVQLNNLGSAINENNSTNTVESNINLLSTTNQNSADDTSSLFPTNTYGENDVDMVTEIINDMMQEEEIKKDSLTKNDNNHNSINNVEVSHNNMISNKNDKTSQIENEQEESSYIQPISNTSQNANLLVEKDTNASLLSNSIKNTTSNHTINTMNENISMLENENINSNSIGPNVEIVQENMGNIKNNKQNNNNSTHSDTNQHLRMTNSNQFSINFESNINQMNEIKNDKKSGVIYSAYNEDAADGNHNLIQLNTNNSSNIANNTNLSNNKSIINNELISTPLPNSISHISSKNLDSASLSLSTKNNSNLENKVHHNSRKGDLNDMPTTQFNNNFTNNSNEKNINNLTSFKGNSRPPISHNLIHKNSTNDSLSKSSEYSFSNLSAAASAEFMLNYKNINDNESIMDKKDINSLKNNSVFSSNNKKIKKTNKLQRINNDDMVSDASIDFKNSNINNNSNINHMNFGFVQNSFNDKLSSYKDINLKFNVPHDIKDNQNEISSNQSNPLNSTGPIQNCIDCGKIFTNKSALAKHRLIHSNERKYACHLCDKSFKRQDHLNGHLLTHQDKKPFECKAPGCDKSYCDSRSLKRHVESQHQDCLALLANGNQEALNYLPSIGKIKANIAPNLQHEIIVNDSKCSKAANLDVNESFNQTQVDDNKLNTVSDVFSTARQKNFFTFEEPKPETCKICGKGFKNIPALNGHMRLHGGFIKTKLVSKGNNSETNNDLINASNEDSMSSNCSSNNSFSSSLSNVSNMFLNSNSNSVLYNMEQNSASSKSTNNPHPKEVKNTQLQGLNQQNNNNNFNSEYSLNNNTSNFFQNQQNRILKPKQKKSIFEQLTQKNFLKNNLNLEQMDLNNNYQHDINNNNSKEDDDSNPYNNPLLKVIKKEYRDHSSNGNPLSVGNNFENLYSKFQLNNPSNTDCPAISNQINNSNSNNNFSNHLGLLSSNQFNEHQQQLLNHHNIENNNFLNHHYQKPSSHQQQYQFEPHSTNLLTKKTNKSSKNSIFESNENENNTKFISNMLQQKTQSSNFHQIETNTNLQTDSNVNSNSLSNYTNTNHHIHYNQSHQQLLLENQNIKHTNTKHCDNTVQVNSKSYPKQPSMIELTEQHLIYSSNNKQPSSILSNNNNSEKQINTEEQLDTITKDSNAKTNALANESSNLEQMNQSVSKAIRSSNSACSSTSSSCFSFTSPCSSASASASNSCVHPTYQMKNQLDKNNDSQSKQFSKQMQSNDQFISLQMHNEDSSNDHKKQQENFVQIVKNCLNSTREIEQPTTFNNNDSSMLTKQIFDAINTAVLLNQVSTPSTTSSFVSHKTSSLLSTPILTTPNPINNNQPSVSNSFSNSLSPSILSVNQNNNESFNRNNLNNITSSNKETRHLVSNMFSSDSNSSSINKNNTNKQKNKPLPLIIPSDISAFQQQKNQQNNQNHLDHSTQHYSHQTNSNNSHHPNQVPYYHQLSANSSNNAYMSHIYPHATLLKSPRLLTNDFKKQYTPPPMLSPFRKGPGLYYKYFANMFLMPNAFNQPKPPQLNHSMSCSYAYSPSLFYNQFLNLHNHNNNSNNSNLSENESKSNLLIKNNNEAMISNRSPSISYSIDKNEVKKDEISKEKDVPALSSLDNSSKNNIIDAISSTNKVNNQQTVSSFTPKQSLIRSRLLSQTSNSGNNAFIQEESLASNEIVSAIFDFAEINNKPFVNIGEDYQASLPKLRKLNEEENYNLREDLMWTPETLNNISVTQFKHYLDLICKSSLINGSSNNLELGLHILQYFNGDAKKSIKAFLDDTIDLPLNHPIRYYKYNETDIWTEEEIKLFENAILKYDKVFFEIANEVENKTIKQCVEFYYLWKKVMSDAIKKKWRNLKKNRYTEIQGEQNLRSRNKSPTNDNLIKNDNENTKNKKYIHDSPSLDNESPTINDNKQSRLKESPSPHSPSLTYNKQGVQRFECGKCSLVFKTKRKLKFHTSLKHPKN